MNKLKEVFKEAFGSDLLDAYSTGEIGTYDNGDIYVCEGTLTLKLRLNNVN